MIDKKLALLQPYLGELDNQIDGADKDSLIDTLIQWFAELNRKPEHKNRQYNQKEIMALLKSSIIQTMFTTFIESILACPEHIKCEVMNVQVWPKQGDERIRSIIFEGKIFKPSDIKKKKKKNPEQLGLPDIDIEDKNSL
eukprot:CAMPEP_0204911384 /NCGR_PEP_ID=MMETSP1397-20131031/9742_1 /ASSEMBLY_ACC=CAM_ASM_000891 /TAXON_ID=49980 /ORGANISM="Climacostomum Climacostomum virens, Strain Stock W-24" /LENGTH=139 /DNA_ID=CAMNT_0052081917 /DNA_START=203 /DNA_END=619 /DNA_ORIENTATION=+